MPPLVEVLAGVVVVLLVVSVFVDAPVTEAPPFEVPLSVPSPVEPPPLGVVAPLELELAGVLEVEFDPVDVFELLLDDDDELFDPEEDAVVAGDAALVVGIVSCGAPFVSLLPRPLPPHAARASPASRAAAPAATERKRRLHTRRRIVSQVTVA